MLPVWSRADIESRILAGDSLVVLNDKVLRVTPSWLAAHPGGALPILHFVGRDASDEICAYHSDATLRRMSNYAVARIEPPWHPLLPPVMSGWVRKLAPDGKQSWYREAHVAPSSPDAIRTQILLVTSGSSDSVPTLDTIRPPPATLSPATQQRHTEAYRALHRKIKQAGLYQTPYLSGYGPEIMRYLLFASISAVAYNHDYFITSAVFLGFLWHQLTFTVHDLGHCGVTHNWLFDRLIAIFLADLLGGLSVGWWVDNHNIHHLVTNHPSHDPDIQHIPFFAISTAFFNNLWSSYYKRTMTFDGAAAFFLSLQHRLFYVVMSLARFNLYANSYSFLVKRGSVRRSWHWYTELVALVAFWVWYTHVLQGTGSWRTALAYFLISNIIPSPLHVQIVLSHFSRSTEDLGPHESFVHRQLRTTTDVVCPPSLEFVHGGLHLQVTHHLFPRLPRHRLREASALVRAFAKEQGLEYAEFGFIEGNHEVRGVLKEVAKQVSIMKMVADAEVKAAIAGGH